MPEHGPQYRFQGEHHDPSHRHQPPHRRHCPSSRRGIRKDLQIRKDLRKAPHDLERRQMHEGLIARREQASLFG